MCHADVSIHTFKWVPEAHYPVLNSQSTHICRKWDPIVEWAKQHYPSHKHGPILEHPKYGTDSCDTATKITSLCSGIIQPTVVNETRA